MPVTKACAIAQKRGASRGYSIVELAIVLAVLGLLLGGAILPIGRQLQERAFSSTSEQIANAIDAVVGYGISRRSPGTNILHSNLSGAVNANDGLRFYGHRTVFVPEGRPYLPCPDIDGDGLEDRSAIYLPAEKASDGFSFIEERRFAVRSGDGGDRAELGENFYDATGDNNPPTHAFGQCSRQFGDLPWATLGLERDDSWGAALTYVVSPHFSTGTFGFDQGTRSTGFIPYFETGTAPLFLPSFYVAARADRELGEAPLIVCNIGDLDLAASELCALENNRDLSTLHYAIPQELTLTLDIQYVRYVADFLRNAHVRQALDGLPFAIISHGPNKKGAAVYDEDGNRICQARFTIDNSTLDPELSNALYGTCGEPAQSGDPIHDDPSSSLSSRLSDRAFDTADGFEEVFNYLFFSHRVPLNDWDPQPSALRPTGIGIEEFDDLVGWISRRELRERMQDAGVFPLQETFHGLFPGLAVFPRII